jgi:hypothetical protein
VDRPCRAQAPVLNFAIVVDGAAVGGIGLTLGTDVSRRSGEIGYWLGPPFWGRGIATEALRAVTDYAFTTPDICRLVALARRLAGILYAPSTCGLARRRSRPQAADDGPGGPPAAAGATGSAPERDGGRQADPHAAEAPLRAACYAASVQGTVAMGP